MSSEFSYFLYQDDKAVKTGHLGCMFQCFSAFLDLTAEALLVMEETWICAEFCGNHRYLEWTGLVKEKEVNKNKYREIN